MLARLMRMAVCGGIAWALTILTPSNHAWSQSAFVKWQIKNAQRNIRIERARVQPLKETIGQLDRISESRGREAQKMATRVNMAYLGASATGKPTDFRSMTQESMENLGKDLVKKLSGIAKKRSKSVLTGGAAKLAGAASGIGTVGVAGIEALDAIAKTVEYRSQMAFAREMKRTWTMYKAGQIGAGSLAAERRAELAQVQRRIAQLERFVRSKQGGAIRSPKGVRIHFDDRILARALGRFGDKTTDENFKRIEQSLFTASSPYQIGAAFRTAANHEKARFIRETKKTVTVRNVVLVSLNAVARAAADSASKQVRDLGGITRVYGFVLVPEPRDVVLVGGIDRGVQPVGLDNLVTALKAVWKKGNIPTVSLDADPSSRLAPKIVRVSGIPKNSRFAKIMLDADSDAKRILLDDPTLRLKVPGFKNLIEAMRSTSRAKRQVSHGRLWLTPEQPEEGEILVSTEQDTVLYETGVRVLTEELQWAGRLDVATGRIDPAAEAAVDSLTKHYREFERRRPVFRQLHALFDLVMLAKVLRQLEVKSDALERLSALPQPRYPVPDTYKTLLVEHVISGGL